MTIATTACRRSSLPTCGPTSSDRSISYVPAPKRRHGYYVVPVLFGDRLVGRIEPRFERAPCTLRIAGIWFEDGFSPMEEPDFVPALATALDAYRRFVGARTVIWPRTKVFPDTTGITK